MTGDPIFLPVLTFQCINEECHADWFCFCILSSCVFCKTRELSSSPKSHGVNMTQKQRFGPTARHHSEVRREEGGMEELREERGRQREVGNARWWD